MLIYQVINFQGCNSTIDQDIQVWKLKFLYVIIGKNENSPNFKILLQSIQNKNNGEYDRMAASRHAVVALLREVHVQNIG